MLGQEISKGERCLLAAEILFTRTVQAELIALGRINAIEADSLPLDLDRVAVDDIRYANQRGRNGGGGAMSKAADKSINAACRRIICRSARDMSAMRLAALSSSSVTDVRVTVGHGFVLCAVFGPMPIQLRVALTPDTTPLKGDDDVTVSSTAHILFGPSKLKPRHL